MRGVGECSSVDYDGVQRNKPAVSGVGECSSVDYDGVQRNKPAVCSLTSNHSTFTSSTNVTFRQVGNF